MLLNGSLRGADGNCGSLARMVSNFATLDIDTLTLAGPMPSVAEVKTSLESADGFLVLTGVYWNSWGSPLQRFLEVATAFENGPAFFGKPVACAVTMDSVGGSDIAARIHASFSGLGCWSPPCSTLVLSRVAAFAVSQTAGEAGDPNDDVWRTSDLEIVVRNLEAAVELRGDWVGWEKLSLKTVDGPWPASGALDMGSPRFL